MNLIIHSSVMIHQSKLKILGNSYKIQYEVKAIKSKMMVGDIFQ